ncbi:hypothetical protein ACZ90_14290 [Streptomyces albus subsp. albus]|nr:hypothetical protein ACZ90_14290 [Streptomyces albus subsp. albus]
MDFTARALPLPRALLRSRPRATGLGFGVSSLHEGPPPAVREAERDLSRAMPPRRRADFLIGRCALHRALRDAGLSAGPVLREGPRPRLPAGIRASLSHSDGIAVAVAGPADRFPVLGVDLELTGIPLRAAHLVLGPTEAPELLHAADASPEQCLLAAYSAKEAAFKALSPLAGDALPGLRAILLRPYPGGYLATAAARPGQQLRVTLRWLPRGVLTWAVPRD